MLSDWLWNRETGDVCGETVLFTESESAVLAFPAEEVTAVYNPTLGAVYAEGRDFRLEQGGRVLRRLPGSTMPFLTRERLYPSHPALFSVYSDNYAPLFLAAFTNFSRFTM